MQNLFFINQVFATETTMMKYLVSEKNVLTKSIETSISELKKSPS